MTPPAQAPDPAPEQQPHRARRAPAPLVAAAALVALEGLLLVIFGVAELRSLSATKATMGVTTSVFFAAYGVGLAWCAWQLSRRASWPRAPIVLAQLIQLGVAWSFRGGDTTAVAAVLALLAVLVLAGVFHPASIHALDAPEGADATDADGQS